MNNVNLSDLSAADMVEVAGGTSLKTQCWLAGAAGVLGVCFLNVEVFTFCAFYVYSYCMD